MPVPSLTHLQFLILHVLIAEDTSGRSLRERLKQEGHRMSRPAFYQFMTRLEDGGMVSGRYTRRVVGGQAFRERWYHLLPQGKRQHKATLNFYERAAAARAS